MIENNILTENKNSLLDFFNVWFWLSIIEFLVIMYLLFLILKNKADEFLVRSIAKSLIHSIENKDIYDEDLVSHYVNALIVIAARNLAKIKPVGIKENADKRILEIINYIQANIFYPQKLKASAVAKEFDISDTYLGSYFKNHSGETIQSFISNYKIRLIEHRLIFSDMRINEIVEEFSFSDESHLNKFFKKHRNISLTGYRKAKALMKLSKTLLQPLVTLQRMSPRQQPSKWSESKLL